MIVEMRVLDGEKQLILIPTNEESKLIDEAIGNKVMHDDGLIAEIGGEVRLADGYGPHYMRIWNITPQKVKSE